MAVKSSSILARVGEVIESLHKLPTMTLGDYFTIDRADLSDHEYEVLEKNKDIRIHDFIMDSVLARMPTEDFNTLAELLRYPANHLNTLLNLYYEAHDRGYE